MTTTKTREEVASTDKWKMEDLFASLTRWEESFTQLIGSGDRPRWPELASYKGRLSEGPEILREALDLYFKILRQLEPLFFYAHLRHDEDIAHTEHKSAYNRALSLYHDFSQEGSWIEPELLTLPDSDIQTYLKSPYLQDYRFHLEKILLVKPHTLSPEKEELMAMTGKALQTAKKAFSALNDADLDFGSATDSEGKEHPLTHASYFMCVRDKDRTLRKNAFEGFHSRFKEFENTFGELLSGVVSQHVFNSRARNYSSCLEAALKPKNIDLTVYHTLVDTVTQNLAPLHRYMKLRKEVLKLPSLHLYDLSVPLTPNLDIRRTYEEAEAVVVESVAPLGEEYQQLLKQGLKDQRWVDRYENQNKRSGAYSSGCYDSHPYILMNYKGLLRDAFTLAHEAGHSMHSLLSRKHQPFHYSEYSIFVAEVASTFNEDLLNRLLLERAESKEERIFLINQRIDDIRATLYRQTMFAQFELMIHEWGEKDIPLTPSRLNEEYHKLCALYFGPDVTIDSSIDIEWARIPHFYYNFYVYQYATGISAALALSDQVLEEGAPAREAYLSFLKSGCSMYPVDQLKMAGVDMTTPTPIIKTIQKFEKQVEELEKLLNEV